MTVLISVGRRCPRSWFRRHANKVKGFLSFQENIWIILRQSLSMAKKKANASGKIKFIMTSEKESEDINYELEWVKIVIQGTEEQEKEEYDEAMKMYGPLNKVFKKDLPVDKNMKQHFKSKILSATKISEAYKQGYGAIGDNNLSTKLLEMGILTHIEYIKDYDSRNIEIVPDF